MQPTEAHNRKIAELVFAKVYPLLLAKVERKGRTRAELNQVIEWLTGLDEPAVQGLIDANATYAEVFRRAALNPAAQRITGMICGYQVEEIEDPLTRKVRYLDKLVDDLARGRSLDKILGNR